MPNPDPHAVLRENLLSSVLEGAGHTEPTLRRAAASNDGVPPELADLVDKIHRGAYQVTDVDVEAAKAHHADDVLFEVFVAAALGASIERLEAGLRALEAAP